MSVVILQVRRHKQTEHQRDMADGMKHATLNKKNQHQDQRETESRFEQENCPGQVRCKYKTIQGASCIRHVITITGKTNCKTIVGMVQKGAYFLHYPNTANWCHHITFKCYCSQRVFICNAVSSMHFQIAWWFRHKNYTRGPSYTCM